MTPSDFSEDRLVERPTLALLERLGYEVLDGFSERLGPEGLGRDDEAQVVLHHRLRTKLTELNPDLSPDAIGLAVEELIRDRSAMDPVRASQVVWDLLRDGIKVTLTDDDGAALTETVVLVDWRSPDRNEFLAVSQFWVVGPLHKRRCDVVCFVNGIPLPSSSSRHRINR